MILLRFKPRKSSREIDRIFRWLVRSATKHVPVYRELYGSSDVSPFRVRGLSDLPTLPIMEKERLFHGEDSRRLREGVKPASCIQVRTGGYTGLPVKIYLSRAEQLFRRLQLLSEWRRLVRLPLALRIADVGSWVEDEAGIATARHGPVSILRVSNGLPLDQQTRRISRFAPHVVSGYPTATALLAEAWERGDADHSPPLLVATRGEVLHEAERAQISNGFGTRIADFYNCEEIGNVASECAADPSVLHVNTDACVVEIVDDQGTAVSMGQAGRILLTSLYARTMPIIRYAICDRGVLLSRGEERCDCGSRRPKLAVIEGRDDDYVLLPNGQKLSPRLVATTMKRNLDAKAKGMNRTRFFKRMQIVQDEIDHLTVRVVREGSWPEGLDAFISQKLCELHPSLRCSVTAVQHIGLESSGKFKKVVRRMNSPDH